MILHKIKPDDIVNYDENNNIVNLQIHTTMDNTVYSIISSLMTKNQGAFGINAQYRGGDTAHMYLTQWINNMTYTYKYDFDVHMFLKTYKRMLYNHTKQLSYKEIYSGITEVIGLINKVMQYGKLIV